MEIFLCIVFLILVAKFWNVRIGIGRRRLAKRQRYIFWTMFVLLGPLAFMYLLEVKVGNEESAVKRKSKKNGPPKNKSQAQYSNRR